MSKKKLILGIVICIVLIVVLTFLISIEKNRSSEEMDISNLEGKLLLSGMSVFSEEYIGEFKTKEIGEKLQDVVKNDIPTLYKDIKKFNENELKQYYKENEVGLKKKFGIQTEEEFLSLGNQIKNVNVDLNTCYKLKIKKESFAERMENSNYAYVEFDVIFEDESTMKFSICIANKKVMSPQYILSVK